MKENTKMQLFIAAYKKLLYFHNADSYRYNILQTTINQAEKYCLQNQNSIPLIENIKRILQFLTYSSTFSLTGDLGKYQVLFWPVQLNHIEMMIPVYKALTKKGKTVAFICAREDVGNLIKAENAPLISILENRRHEVSYDGFRRWRQLRKISKSTSQLEKPLNSFGIYFQNALNGFYFLEDYSIIFNIAQEMTGAEYHLLGYDFSTVCRAVNVNANYSKIPTGNIQHGAINYILSQFSICTHQFVWDKITYDYLHNSGYQGKVYLTGSPRIKQNNGQNSSTSYVSAYINDSNKKAILICFSGPGHNVSENGHIENINILNALIPKYSDELFIVKLHPKDDISYYKALLKYENILLIDNQHKFYKEPVHQYLHKCKAIITGGSTVAIEALHAKIPAISLDVNVELNHVDFLKSDLIYKCYNENDLKLSLDSVLKNDNTFQRRMAYISKYSESFHALQNNNPATVIADIIEKTIQN
jgi:hypothetical protein